MADFYKVRAERGFRTFIKGELTTLVPGDVVTLKKDDALTAKATGRGVIVDESTPEARVKNYVPERKRLAVMSDLDRAKAEVARLEAAAKTMKGN